MQRPKQSFNLVLWFETKIFVAPGTIAYLIIFLQRSRPKKEQLKNPKLKI